MNARTKARGALNRASDRTAGLALMLGGALWGFVWIPLRALEDAGLPGAWAGMLIYVGALALLSPLLLFRSQSGPSDLRQLILGGITLGARIIRELDAHLERDGFENIAQAVGADH